MNIAKLTASLVEHEGLRTKAYQDTKGIWTIGYGRNLQQLTITERQAKQWLEDDIQTALREAAKFPEYSKLDTDARQNVFVEMVFNLGALKVRGFKNMLAAMKLQAWNTVAHEMLDSLWAKQAPNRVRKLAALMITGHF